MKYLLLILSFVFSTLTYAAPKSDLWSYWNSSDEQNNQSISHHEWQQFLDDYVIVSDENTLVLYSSVSEADKNKLRSYLSNLASIDPRIYNKAEQYAYWVNLYNGLTVKLILDNYPIKSITKLGGLFSFGPWGDNVVTVSGKKLTLNDIEHRILRPIWKDPRTHYAVNCASLGCPNLQSVAFTAENQEMLLEQAAGDFINSDKGVALANDEVVLSSIYEWFISDFGNKEMLIKHFKKYRPTLVIDLSDATYDYDWDLNESQK